MRLDHGRDVVAPVPDPNLGLERPRGRRLAGHPRDAIGDRARPRQQLPRPDDHPVRRRVDLEHVGGLGARDAETTPLPDRERRRTPVPRQHASVRVDDLALAHQVRRDRGQVRARLAARREAQLLRIGLARDRQPEALGGRARVGLRHPADREERPRQLALAEHVQHVRLVLGAVGAAQQPETAVAPIRPHVVPGRHGVDPELVRPPQEGAELDLAVAARARVRGTTGLVLGHEVADHGPLELVGQVADLEREPRDPGDLRGIVPRGRPAAAVFHPVEVDQPHVRAHDVVALLEQQAGGDRRVDATGHRDEHGSLRRHGSDATRCMRRRRRGYPRAEPMEGSP